VGSNSKNSGLTEIRKTLSWVYTLLTSHTTERYLGNKPKNFGKSDTLRKEHKFGNVKIESYFLGITKIWN